MVGAAARERGIASAIAAKNERRREKVERDIVSLLRDNWNLPDDPSGEHCGAARFVSAG
jgi:hypothetical protein